MAETGLIKRQSGRYYLTAFGKIVYCCTMINGDNNYWKLKAIDSLAYAGRYLQINISARIQKAITNEYLLPIRLNAILQA
jgi:hypothetical protein